MLAHAELGASERDATEGPDASLVWVPDILHHVAKHLTDNELALLRPISKATADHFRVHATIRLSQPVPPWAFEQRWAQPGSCRSLNRAQREKLVSLVAASDVVANLKVALAAAGLTPRSEDLDAAARAGALATCKHLAERLPFAIIIAFRAAANAGRRVVCEWIMEDGAARISARDIWIAAKHAAKGGQLSIMEWLLEKQPSMLAADELMYAVWGGFDLPTARRLHRQHCELNGLAPEDEWEPDELSAALASALHDPTPQWRSKVEWLLEQGAEVPQDDDDSEGGWYSQVSSLAGYRQLPDEAVWERFEWLRSIGYPLRPVDSGGEHLGYAISGCCTAAVTWLLEHGAIPDAADIDSSDLLPDQLHDKHLGVLLALKAAGCLELRDFVHQAAAGGAMAVLEWAGEEWDWAEAGVLTPELFKSGAKSGSVDVIRWLLQRGCPMSEEAWSKAAKSGCAAAVELLADLGCPMPADGEPYVEAIGEPYKIHGREWRILPLLRKVGVPLGPQADSQGIFTRAVSRGAPIATLEWLLAEGCRADWGKARATVGKHDEFLEPFEDSKVNVLAWLSRKEREEDERARQQRT